MGKHPDEVEQRMGIGVRGVSSIVLGFLRAESVPATPLSCNIIFKLEGKDISISEREGVTLV